MRGSRGGVGTCAEDKGKAGKRRDAVSVRPREREAVSVRPRVLRLERRGGGGPP